MVEQISLLLFVQSSVYNPLHSFIKKGFLFSSLPFHINLIEQKQRNQNQYKYNELRVKWIKHRLKKRLIGMLQISQKFLNSFSYFTPLCKRLFAFTLKIITQNNCFVKSFSRIYVLKYFYTSFQKSFFFILVMHKFFCRKGITILLALHFMYKKAMSKNEFHFFGIASLFYPDLII